jgi:hypothetical protein
MGIFPAYASNFEFYPMPRDTETYRHLAPLLEQLKRIDFHLRVGARL